MDRKRQLTLIFAMAGVALGAGHIVQNGIGSAAQVTGAALTPTDVIPVSAGPEAARPAPLVVAEHAAKPVLTAALTDPLAATPAQPKLPAPIVDACPVTLDLVGEPMAMIGVVLTAPCAPDTRVVLRHAGLAITARTSITGSLFLSLPALDMNGEVTASLKGEDDITGAVAMPALADLRRFGVQWQSDDAFQLHAFENGAAFGAPGHVSAAVLQGVAPGSGMMTLLGDATVTLPMLAEVYTYPASGMPEVVVEAAVTVRTCGRELLGETISSAAGIATTMELTLATPDCTAIGDILMLNNLVADPTMVAAN